jgi:DNA mismatch endonuclease (patch repair protein)
VLPKYNTVIFVQGCFFHGHYECKDFKWPKTNQQWWEEKIINNKKRDEKNQAKLEEMGWIIIVIWECELKSPSTESLTDKMGPLFQKTN